jgi:tRNA threonylcarbamoyladenosine biosynthesis protein TsaB
VTPRVLALDVSGPGGGAALLGPEGLRTAAVPLVQRGRDLLPLVASLLGEAGLAPADLDLVACGVGPGSFTGMRIAVATAAALAFAAGKPVLDVGSLHGIAANAPPEARRILVALDARRGRVFACRFAWDGDLPRALEPYRVLLPEEAVAGLPPDAWVLGDARTRHPGVFERYPGAADPPVRPEVCARLAAARFALGERKRPEELRPLYLRLSDPELKRDEGA